LGGSSPRGQHRRRGLAAPLALPAGFAGLLAVGALAAGTGGRVDAIWVLILATVVVAAGSVVAEPAVAPLLGLIGWLTVTGFSRAPYAQLHPAGAGSLRAAITMAACSLAGAATGVIVRRIASSFTLWIVDVSDEGRSPADPAGGPAGSAGRPDLPAASLGEPRRRWAARVLSGLSGLSSGIGRRRLLAGAILVAGLPLLTIALVAWQQQLSLADDLLVYLVAVVAVAVVGGFWPAVLAAVSSSLLLNWYFTRPVHTLTIADPQNLLALMLFITVAVTVSSVVHLAAHRALQAARSSQEAAELLALARTVLGGADTPTAVLEHLTGTKGGRAELAEHVGGQWVRVAASGSAPPGAATVRVEVRPDLALVISAPSRQLTARLLDGFAAQAASALDRDRLRTQAAQAEALAEGNRMRTALLAAVSHDLRTPLASIKASVSTLRQTDVQWTPADEAALLATIEQGADRLDALIGNLLDMSRLSAGSLQPFLRPTAIDEVAPVALRGLDEGGTVRLVVPDRLPLVRTDPGLLERVLANLFANALAFSPPGRPPVLHARPAGSTVVLEIIDRGPGVPDRLKPRMFEPFERLEARNTGTGVGLGLAVVKGFLDTMGGSVAAADTPGGGLTIVVTLPAASRPVGAAVAADP
jgi:two-component system sensor histidine kinase KdpD